MHGPPDLGGGSMYRVPACCYEICVRAPKIIRCLAYRSIGVCRGRNQTRRSCRVHVCGTTRVRVDCWFHSDVLAPGEHSRDSSVTATPVIAMWLEVTGTLWSSGNGVFSLTDWLRHEGAMWGLRGHSPCPGIAWTLEREPGTLGG